MTYRVKSSHTFYSTTMEDERFTTLGAAWQAIAVDYISDPGTSDMEKVDAEGNHMATFSSAHKYTTHDGVTFTVIDIPGNGYSAGWNMPGCLPDNDPAEFDTFCEGIAYLVDAVERFWDADYAMIDDHDAVDAVYLPIHTALHNAGHTTDDGMHHFSGIIDGTTPLVFWVVPRA